MPSESPEHSPMLSIVMTGRDDEYMRDFRYRLATTLNYMARCAAGLDRLNDVELIVVDWGSAIPMSSTLHLTPEAERITRFLYVDPGQLIHIQGGTEGFHATKSMNAGLRRAAGQFIMLGAADTLLSEFAMGSLLKVLDGTQPLPHNPAQTFFFCSRRDVPWQFIARRPSLDELERFLVTTQGEHIDRTGTTLFAVTSGAGALMMHRNLWAELRGLDESLSGWGFNDIDLGLRSSQKYPWMEMSYFGVVTFHMEHTPYIKRSSGLQNINPHAFHLNIQANDDNWGLATFPLQLRSSARSQTTSFDSGNSGSEQDRTKDPLAEFPGADWHSIRSVISQHPQLFDFLWNTRLSSAKLRALALVTWHARTFFPRRYVQSGIDQSSFPAVIAASHFSPAAEVFVLHEWGDAHPAPSPENIAVKIRRDTRHAGYVRFVNGPSSTSVVRFAESVIGPLFIDLALVDVDALGNEASVHVQQVLALLSTEGVVIVAGDNLQRFEQMWNSLARHHDQFALLRDPKFGVGIICFPQHPGVGRSGHVPAFNLSAFGFGFQFALRVRILGRSVRRLMVLAMHGSIGSQFRAWLIGRTSS